MSILSRIKELLKGSKKNTKSRDTESSAKISSGAKSVSNFGSTELNRKYQQQKQKEAEQKRKVEKAFKAKEPAQQLKATAKSAGDGRIRATKKLATIEAKTEKKDEKKKTALSDPKIEARSKARETNKKAAEAFRVKTPEEMIATGDYQRAEAPRNANTRSADERPSIVPSRQGLEKMYSDKTYATLMSVARGAPSGASAGIMEPLFRGYGDSEYDRMQEEIYQQNKNKLAEGVSRFAGGMALYGGTAGAFENLGTQAVGRAAETQLGRKLGAESLAKLMAGNGAKSAIARSLVGDTIQDSTVGLIDTMTDVAGRDDLNSFDDYLKAVAKGQALNYGMGLLGNAAFHGLPVAREAWNDFADESRRLYVIPKEFAGIDNLNREFAGIDINKGLTKEEQEALRSRQKAIKAEANRLEAVAQTAEPADKRNLLAYVQDLRAESGGIDRVLKRNVGESATDYTTRIRAEEQARLEKLEAEGKLPKDRILETKEELAEKARKAKEEEAQVIPKTEEEIASEKAEKKAKSEQKKRQKKKESEARKRFNEEAEAYMDKMSAQANSKDGTIATRKNWRTGKQLKFWKEDGRLYVGDPKGEYKSFGKDTPENRRAAEDEFDLWTTGEQKFTKAREKEEAAKKKAQAASEKPKRPANVRQFSKKKLEEMKRLNKLGELTKAEYDWYFPKEDFKLEFGGADNEVEKGVKSKEAQQKLDELILDGKETRTFTAKQLEKKLSASNKRLSELEGRVKGSAYDSKWKQDKLSGKYTHELEANKRYRELLEKARSSEDGKVTMAYNKPDYVKKAVDESEVTTTKGALEIEGKKKRGGKSKAKNAEAPKTDTEAKDIPFTDENGKAVTGEAKAEAKTEVEAESKKKLSKAEKNVKSLENKVANAEREVKKIDKELKKKRKEGASEKSIAWWEEQRANAAAKRKELKSELRKAKKELGVETKPQDAALKEGAKEPPKKVSESVDNVKAEASEAPTDKQIKKIQNRLTNAENQVKRFEADLARKQEEGATEKSIAFTKEKLEDALGKKAEIEAELRNTKGELESKVETTKYDVKVADTKGKEHNVVVEAKSSPEAKRLGASQVEDTLEHDVDVADSKVLGRTETEAKNKALKSDAEIAPPEAKKTKGGKKTKTDNTAKATETKAKKEPATTLNDEGFASVDESPFEKTATKAESNKSKTKKEPPTEKQKKVKAANKKLNEKKKQFRRNPIPRGEGLHKGVYKEVTGKELDEAINPPTFKDYLDAKKTYETGQASNEAEVVSRAGTSIMNATTADAQREFLRKGWKDGDFHYRRIKNKQKYAEVMERWVKEPEATAREIIRYNNDLSKLSADKIVDTHYQAHCIMKMLRSELDNPALSKTEQAAVREIYSSAASLSQKLSSVSGQVNQFQGVMVHCTPAKRSDNALDNIASILDSSRGYRRKARIEIDGKEVRLSDSKAKRMEQIKALLLEDKDIQKNLEKIYNAKTEEEYGEAMSELLLSTHKLNHATGLDYIQQWRYLSMLGNPKTHLRNMVGNVTFGTLRTVSNTVRSIEENLLGDYAAKHGLEIDYHGGLSPKAWRQARFKNAADDEASKKAWEYFEKHKGKILGAQKYDSPELAAGFKHLSELNTNLLGKEDDLFRAPAYREQFIKGYNKFAKKGEITDEILERIHSEALKESQIATFNEFSELAQILASSQRGLYDANASLGKQAVGFVSNALMPFTKVPANILKQSVNYTPVGGIKGVAHILDAARQGDSALFNKALDELASGITGTGIAALGFFLGKHTDIFTTNAGSEDAAAKFKKQQGVQNYSATVNLPNGKTYSFTLDWLVPASCTFFTGVEVANQFKNGIGGANIFEATANLSQVMSRIIDPVLETSMLSSIYNIVENSRKSNSYDDQSSFLNIAARELAQSYISSFVPTLQGQLARSFIYDADKMVTGEGDREYWINSMKLKMGLANKDILGGKLGDDTNAYGEVKNKKEDFGDKAWSFVKNGILPTNIQEVNLSELDKQKIKEYEDYVAAGGDPADKEYLFPKKQYRKNFTVGKDGADPMDIKLNNEQVSLYNQAKTSGGAEGMRVVLEGIMFNRYDKDSSGKRTILKNGYTAEQKEKLIKQFEGKSMREVEEWLYKQPQFRSANEEEKQKVLNSLWSYTQSGKSQGAKRVGEQAVIKAQGKDIDEYNFKNELSKAKQVALLPYVESGLLTWGECVDFSRYAGKTYYYENDEGGSSSTYYNKKQMMEYLMGKGYSYEKAEALYNAFKSSTAKDYDGTYSSGRKGRGGYGRRRGGGGSSAKVGKARASAYTTKTFKGKVAAPAPRKSSSSANLAKALLNLQEEEKKVAPPKRK